MELVEFDFLVKQMEVADQVYQEKRLVVVVLYDGP